METVKIIFKDGSTQEYPNLKNSYYDYGWLRLDWENGFQRLINQDEIAEFTSTPIKNEKNSSNLNGSKAKPGGTDSQKV